MSSSEVKRPFRSAHIAAKAPEVLAYAGLTGFAFLVSRGGKIGARSASVAGVDVDGIARLVSARRWRDADDEVVAFAHPGCVGVHAVHVSHGWVLCVVSKICVSSSAVVARLRRARSVLLLAIASESAPVGGAGGGGGPAPAEVALEVPAARRSS